MATINENFLKLQAGYLFPEIGRRMRAFKAANPKADVISMGIGDVTQPIVPEVVNAMKDAADKMGTKEGLHGYGPDMGYDFLRSLIVENDYKSRGADIDIDEIFISDGAKCDTGNMQEIFGLNNIVAVTDPVYPVYVDTNVMAGRTGNAKDNGQYDGIVYMPVNAENNFNPELPKEKVDLIYLCYPNNPTGAVIDKKSLTMWVNYAKENKAIILYDAAYEAYISEPDIPHTIYEIEGAKEVAIEFRSFSKTAGFTGLRCGFSVVPKQLKAYTKTGDAISVNQIWSRRHCTKFNGASFVSQAAAAAVYSPRGKQQVKEVINIYMDNAARIRKALSDLGYEIFGGINAPYIWMKTPDGMSSWEFFDMLLEKTHLVGTPGSGFGLAGEGYFRLTAFGLPENVMKL